MIETPRLLVRPLRPSDFDELLAYFRDPEVAKHQSWEPSEAEARARAFVESSQALGDEAWVNVAVELRATGALIGDVAMRVEPGRTGAEIGFTLSSAHQGQGLGREAVGAVCDYALGALALPRLFAITDARNAPAIRMLEALGFRNAGFHARGVLFKGEPCDELRFEK